MRGLFCPRYFFWRCLVIANEVNMINEEIQEKKRVSFLDYFNQDNTILFLWTIDKYLFEAQKIADEQDLDLVMISPNAKPPVCKIMDYGKYRFEQNKKVKEAKKNQHVMDVKEIRMSPGIGENDFNTKLKNGQKFLADGDRVKVTVRFRGREMAHTNIGEKLLRDFAEKCAEVANLDKEPKLEGRNMSIFLSPKSQNQLKKEQKAKKQAAEKTAAEQDA